MAIPTTLSSDKSASGVSPILSNTSAFLDLLMGTQQNTSGGSSSVSSGETDTKQTVLSDTAINDLIRGMMEGTGGLADVATGAHTAGLYGDTTQVSLVQNLLTKIAGATAVAGAPTVTTTGPKSTVVNTATKTSTPPKLTGDALLQSLLVGGTSLIGQRLIKKSGILDELGLGDTAVSNGIGSSAATEGAVGGGQFAGNITDSVFSAPETLSAPAASLSSSAATGELLGAEPLVGGGTGEADLATTASSGLDATSTLSSAGEVLYGGEEIGGLVGAGESAGAVGGASFAEGASEGADAASSIGSSFSAPGPLADIGGAINIAGDIANGDATQVAGDALGGSIFGDVLGESSIVCYELVRTGGMTYLMANTSSEFAKKLPKATIRGYHWACPWLLKMMRTKKWAYKILQICAEARAQELYKSNVGGKLVRIVFEPICWILGHTLGRKAPLTFNISEVLANG